MTVEEIILVLGRERTIELNLISGEKIQFELTPTKEYVVNYFEHNRINKSEIFSELSQFTLFLRSLHEKNILKSL